MRMLRILHIIRLFKKKLSTLHKPHYMNMYAILGTFSTEQRTEQGMVKN